MFMAVRVALRALARNKMRTALTMLGMIIGVSAVITLMALGLGAQIEVEQQIKNGGTNMVQVFAGSTNQGGVRTGGGTAVSLTVADATAIRAEIPAVEYLAIGVRSQQQVVAGNQNWYTRVQGTDVELPKMREWHVQSGTFFTEEDVVTAARVCVLGTIVNAQLFGDGRGVGQTIRVRNQPCKVIGVMAPKGATADGDMDDQILAPYTTVMKRLVGQQNITAIMMSTYSADDVLIVSEQLTTLLRALHKIPPGGADDFNVRTIVQMAEVRSETTEAMTTLLAGIAGVSLLVGGVNIMNIMLVSIRERTREIGLRMAIGAKRRDVLLQFLTEAILLSLVGGSIGIALGFGAAVGMDRWLGWPAQVPESAVTLAFGFTAAVGILFGFYPAQKAPRLDPIEALRFE